MSTPITQCPRCHTRFLVTPDQLAAHNGDVRCGHCDEVFKATENLHNDEPRAEPTPPVIAPPEKTELPLAFLQDDTQPDHYVSLSTTADELETLVQQIVTTEDLPPDNKKIKPPKPKTQPKPPRTWPWAAGSLVFLLLIFMQGLYFFRVEIAAQLPGVKPVLTLYCDLLKCAVPLPSKVELMNIESSDLVADPLQPNVVTLIALLHNHAEYTQAYPSFELSLTDIQDKVLARRTFAPSDYLSPNDNEKLGLGANREINIKIHLDSSELRPSGYKLLLFFP